MFCSRKLSDPGDETDLIQRMAISVSNVWDETNTEDIMQVKGYPNIASGPVNFEATKASQQYNDTFKIPQFTNRRNSLKNSASREMELVRRERELVARELELVRRENTFSSCGSGSNQEGYNRMLNMKLKGIGELLGEFNGEDDSFPKWEQQFALVRSTYDLDYNTSKMLLSSKLRGRALSWFNLLPDNPAITLEELMSRMRLMFDRRPTKLTLRREFEARTWKFGETFSNYFHDKVTLGNRILISDDEVLDYIIEGIPHPSLRDKARMMRFATKYDLLAKFEKMTLRPWKAKEGDRSQKKVYTKPEVNDKDINQPTTTRQSVRCYNCREEGHVFYKCPNPRRVSGFCFCCGALQHQLKDCPKNAKIASTPHVIKPTVLNITEALETNKYDYDVAVEEMMRIDYKEISRGPKYELQINPKLSIESVDMVETIFVDDYLFMWGVKTMKLEHEMKICLKMDNEPFSFPPDLLALSDQQKLQVILDELKSQNIIRPSNSPYASPIVIVRKKNRDEISLFVDFRRLNKITINDNSPTQLTGEQLNKLVDNKYYTTLHLKEEFHLVKMSESSIKYTSFITPLGQYEYLRMPFGLSNASREFQRFISKIFNSLVKENKIVLYLNDILIATDTINEHCVILGEVLTIANKFMLRFRLDKCYFLFTEIKYLGYHISRDGIRPTETNIASVTEYPVPRNAKELYRFLYLFSYFRQFIPEFPILTKPLYDLMKKKTDFSFDRQTYEIFEKLKMCLATPPILAIYSPELETELHYDASESGFGAILLQKQLNGNFKPVAYYSYHTSTTESRYHIPELECLAVVNAIKQFHVYLQGIKFKVITKRDSFRLNLKKSKLPPWTSKWAITYLMNYDFEIVQVVQKSGLHMTHVDALSRCHSVFLVGDNLFERTLQFCQDHDDLICKIKSDLEKKASKFFELRNGVVYRKDQTKRLLLYVARSMENDIIKTYHNNFGHLNTKKVLNIIQRIYWFPRMKEKVQNHIANCAKCIKNSLLSGKREEFLYNLEKDTDPFLTIYIDFSGPLEKTAGKGFNYIFSIVDGFTKFIRLYPCKSTTSEEAIKHLNDYFRSYSKSKRIVSDRNASFTSNTFKNFLENKNISQVLVDLGTPRNGQVERLNRVIVPMIAKICDSPNGWDRILSDIEFSLNNIVYKSISNIPSKLLFGVRQFGVMNDIIRLMLETCHTNDKDLEKHGEATNERNSGIQEEHERYYNNHRNYTTKYNIGDLNLLQNIDSSMWVNKKYTPKLKGPYGVKKN